MCFILQLLGSILKCRHKLLVVVPHLLGEVPYHLSGGKGSPRQSVADFLEAWPEIDDCISTLGINSPYILNPLHALCSLDVRYFSSRLF